MEPRTLAWITFNPQLENIETFLENSAPSKVLRSNCAWICARRPANPQEHFSQEGALRPLNPQESFPLEEEEEQEEEDEQELEQEQEQEDQKALWPANPQESVPLEEADDIAVGSSMDLKTAWESLCASHKPTYQEICNLAKAQRCLVGKWLIFVDTTEVDRLWSKVARAVVDGSLDFSAKVSPSDPNNPKNPLHVICVYNADFTDIPAVKRLEGSLRDLGIIRRMTYKPDLFTHLGIYSNNRNIKSTLYSSQYDLQSQEFVFQYDQRVENQHKITEFMSACGTPHKKKTASTGPTWQFSRAAKTPQSTSGRRKSKLPKSCSALPKSQKQLENFFEKKGSPKQPLKDKLANQEQRDEGDLMDSNLPLPALPTFEERPTVGPARLTDASASDDQQ